MAGERVVRFGRTERTLHWVHAAAFMVMLATGLVLYVPMLAQAVSARPLTKAVHLVTAAGWLLALALIALLGDRRALARTRRDVERFDADDRQWLRRRPAPQGRFNAGQKVHSILQAALAVTFAVSGALLWLGERDHSLQLPGTLALHDFSTFAGIVLVAGHLYKAINSPGAMDGIISGSVPAAWAAEHHPKWRGRPVGRRSSRY